MIHHAIGKPGLILALALGLVALASLAVGTAYAEPPSKVTGVTAERIDGKSFLVSWEPPYSDPPIKEYNILYCLAADPCKLGDGTIIRHTVRDGTADEATITHRVKFAQTYQVMIVAYNSDGDSEWSDPVLVSLNLPPVIDQSEPISLDVDENTPAGTAVQNGQLTATDPEGHALTWSITGGDTGFIIDPDTGQIKVGDSVILDHESGKIEYSFTVAVEDTHGGQDEARVDITVQDLDEPPGEIADLKAEYATDSVVGLSWTAPDATGKEPISGYDVRYCAGPDCSDDAVDTWTDAGYEGTGTAAVITQLEWSNDYKFRVKANNAEGSSAWAPSVATTTTARLYPGFGDLDTVIPDQMFTVGREVFTSPGLDVPWNALPSANAGDATLVYSVEPGLPDGLQLDPKTRQIVGTATTSQPAMTYAYVATANGEGDNPEKATLMFSIEVLPAVPAHVDARSKETVPAPGQEKEPYIYLCWNQTTDTSIAGWEIRRYDYPEDTERPYPTPWPNDWETAAPETNDEGRPCIEHHDVSKTLTYIYQMRAATTFDTYSLISESRPVTVNEPEDLNARATFVTLSANPIAEATGMAEVMVRFSKPADTETSFTIELESTTVGFVLTPNKLKIPPGALESDSSVLIVAVADQEQTPDKLVEVKVEESEDESGNIEIPIPQTFLTILDDD